jgi:hypothetical protein
VAWACSAIGLDRKMPWNWEMDNLMAQMKDVAAAQRAGLVDKGVEHRALRRRRCSHH